MAQVLKLLACEKDPDALIHDLLDRGPESPVSVMADCIVLMARSGSSLEDVGWLDYIFERRGLHGFRAVFLETRKKI